jgi:hypothetical protein
MAISQLPDNRPQDEVIACDALFDPHGEEARSAVSNHEAPMEPQRRAT